MSLYLGLPLFLGYCSVVALGRAVKLGQRDSHPSGFTPPCQNSIHRVATTRCGVSGFEEGLRRIAPRSQPDRLSPIFESRNPKVFSFSADFMNETAQRLYRPTVTGLSQILRALRWVPHRNDNGGRS